MPIRGPHHNHLMFQYFYTSVYLVMEILLTPHSLESEYVFSILYGGSAAPLVGVCDTTEYYMIAISYFSFIPFFNFTPLDKVQRDRLEKLYDC
jgi:hypothetical protein